MGARALQNDGIIMIAVGNSRRCTSWQNKELPWSDLAARLAIPTRTSESVTEYTHMPKSKRDEIKDVGGFVGGVLRGGRRKADAIIQRRLITLDLDSIPTGEDPWPAFELVLDCAAVLYSTHSHTRANQRLRLVIPLSRAVSPDEYAAVSRRIAGDIGIDMCDDTTFEPHRLMYWPSASYDAPFRYEIIDAPWLDVDEQLKRYTDWRDPAQWPVSSRKRDIMDRLAKKQGDPYEKPGIVGAFCRTYPVEEAIEQFLPSTYKKAGDGRYTYTGGSTSGGLVLYENGKFAYSHHGTDPISGKLCNSFDLVRLHMFGDRDDDVDPSTPVNRLPSYQAMSELAIEDEAVREELNLHNLAEITSALDEDGDTDSAEWVKTLSVTVKGNIEPTIENALIIMKNDPRIKDRYYYDAFRERPIVCGDLPWQDYDQRQSDGWLDSDDAGLRNHLEKFYKISNPPKVRDAVELAMIESSRHPVREYLTSLEWDGVKRADALFIDYLGAEDSRYTREVTRKALIGAVARIMEPGCKHDHVLVLIGPQGCGKSTTIMKLGKKWYSDSLYTMSGKDAYEQLQGYWILEMGEMAATKKADIEQIKQFVSKQSDSYRAAYARRTQEHPRQCAFFGTTNDDEFLRDSTGGRRFWPVVVSDEGRELSDKLTDETVDQIWAEILTRYRSGEPWYLSPEDEAVAREVQEQHTELSSKQGLIENFLDVLLPKDWNNRSLEERLLFFNGGFSGEEAGTEIRDRVCAIEIWQELFHGDPKAFTPQQAREINNILRRVPGWEPRNSINCGPLYGRQRCFMRSVTL
ncbi:MAG: hypothetical protein IJG87_06585 [Ruminococcus sp.]|nr:hypothetical protein [Ruminococcus sp.]